jgi:cytochrome b pre-mRNA-processing protein 3
MNNFLLSVYNKIIEQSKKNFFFKDLLIPDEFNFRLEIFELNLILILWYMKSSHLKKKNIESIVSFFIKDLELLLREAGESDTSVPRKMRKLVENFYGRLNSYSNQFDILLNGDLKKIEECLKKNFIFKKIKYSSLGKYILVNVKYFSKLKVSDFEDLKFEFALIEN